MVNVIVDKEMTDGRGKWSQFVEMNKYFCAPLIRSLSAPCIQSVGKKQSAPAFGPNNLSLSWQLACNPADSSHLNDDCGLRSHSKSDRPVAKDLKYLNSSGKRKPKLKPTYHRKRNVTVKPKVTPVGLPKIMVVDATKKSPIRQNHDEHQAHKDWEDRRSSRESRKEQAEIPYNKPDQPTTTTRAKNPRPDVLVKPKRTYGVPLCYRPTMLLGPRYYSDLQYYNQQQYYNQLQAQQRQQQLMQQRIYYQPMQHLTKAQQEYYDQGPRYAVPIESMYRKLQKGSCYCGNFYYR
ncbi:uncharacterized protein LOC117783973 [Drosophila innubila]|uniref:uncharacterized protein LOC117783973 n=1 Tax=Drosophila innubila TaxID=198719 RepID=UPI00148D07ED|nr:uncharacterized protein LOC117783973 [Drosophila innubila]